MEQQQEFGSLAGRVESLKFDIFFLQVSLFGPSVLINDWNKWCWLFGTAKLRGIPELTQVFLACGWTQMPIFLSVYVLTKYLRKRTNL